MRSAKNTKIAGAALLVHRIELQFALRTADFGARVVAGDDLDDEETTSVLVLRRAYRTEGGAN